MLIISLTSQATIGWLLRRTSEVDPFTVKVNPKGHLNSLAPNFGL